MRRALRTGESGGLVSEVAERVAREFVCVPQAS